MPREDWVTRFRTDMKLTRSENLLKIKCEEINSCARIRCAAPVSSSESHTSTSSIHDISSNLECLGAWFISSFYPSSCCCTPNFSFCNLLQNAAWSGTAPSMLERYQMTTKVLSRSTNEHVCIYRHQDICNFDVFRIKQGTRKNTCNAYSLDQMSHWFIIRTRPSQTAERYRGS